MEPANELFAFGYWVIMLALYCVTPLSVMNCFISFCFFFHLVLFITKRTGISQKWRSSS